MQTYISHKTLKLYKKTLSKELKMSSFKFNCCCISLNALIVIYCPYEKDLEEIRKLASDELDSRFAFINWADDKELPYLVEDGDYTDLNVLEFEVPQEDKDFLTERVILAKDKLNELLKQK